MLDIPKATAKRLPLYHRCLRSFMDMGKARVSSSELSEALKIDSATIRRDFSHFGRLGKRGYGYDVARLVKFFNEQLFQDQLTQVVLVGVGHLGNALIQYNFKRTESVRIVAAFDRRPELIGTVLNGVPIYDSKDMVEKLQGTDIKIMILAVPVERAAMVTELVAQTDIKGILNFTPVALDVPDDIYVQNVDLANELQMLIYYIGMNEKHHA